MSDALDPEQRRQLAAEIAASRRELEALTEQINLGAVESFDATIRPAVITLMREVRAALVQIWHRVNAETIWQGAMRGPLCVDDLSPLLQSTMAEMLSELEVKPRLEVDDSGALSQLVDHDFPDGTALEIALGHEGSEGFPLARLALVLVPTDRYIVLLAGWILGRSHRGKEWPRLCRVRAKIGPHRADRWDHGDMQAFVSGVVGDFHAAVAEEAKRRRGAPSSPS